MDHGSQYLSDHFTNQIKFWGIQPSYAFVAEPQTNGVAERFNRTLKEQIIHGRIYRNIAELRDAVRDFVELYNAQWIVEKNGYLSPAQARQAWHAAISIKQRREARDSMPAWRDDVSGAGIRVPHNHTSWRCRQRWLRAPATKLTRYLESVDRLP